MFTQEYEGFDDGRWKHCHNEISEKDKTNIERINFLYEAIRRWAVLFNIITGLIEYSKSRLSCVSIPFVIELK